MSIEAVVRGLVRGLVRGWSGVWSGLKAKRGAAGPGGLGYNPKPLHTRARTHKGFSVFARTTRTAQTKPMPMRVLVVRVPMFCLDQTPDQEDGEA